MLCFQGRTVVVVAHRAALLARADDVIEVSSRPAPADDRQDPPESAAAQPSRAGEGAAR